jgi:hypothetical protein
VLVAGLNRWRWVADSRVEQSPEGEGAPGPASETTWLQVASVSCCRSSGVHRLRSEGAGWQVPVGFMSAGSRGGAYGVRFRPLIVRVELGKGVSKTT